LVLGTTTENLPQPLRGWELHGKISQGSLADEATLGFVAKPLRGFDMRPFDPHF
jgi:hypothetical protein